jgi:hypothetical protein
LSPFQHSHCSNSLRIFANFHCYQIYFKTIQKENCYLHFSRESHHSSFVLALIESLILVRMDILLVHSMKISTNLRTIMMSMFLVGSVLVSRSNSLFYILIHLFIFLHHVVSLAHFIFSFNPIFTVLISRSKVTIIIPCISYFVSLV